MQLRWLYGTQTRLRGYGATFLPSLTLDVEVLMDLRDRAIPLIKSPSNSWIREPEITSSLVLDGEEISDARLVSLDILDKDRVRLVVTARGFISNEQQETVSLTVESSSATIYVAPFGSTPGSRLADQLHDMAVDRLYSAGRRRVSWPHLRKFSAWAPLVIAVGLWVWLAFTVPMPLPAHLLAAVATAVTSVMLARWFRDELTHADASRRSLRYRGESREATNRRRADRHANLRTSLISIFFTSVAALVTAYITGLFD